MNPTRRISSWHKVSGASIGLAVMALPLAAVVGPQASAGGTADRAAPPHPVTRLISKAGPGRSANAGSQGVAINADCTAIAFSSVASNLTSDDLDGHLEVFVRSRGQHRATLVSRGRGGRPANDDSWISGISGSGRYVTYQTEASNLVKGDANGLVDVFIRDLTRRFSERVSVARGGGSPNADSVHATVSMGGRFVAFQSNATNLVAGDTNDSADIFVRDRVMKKTTRVSVGLAGQETDDRSIGGSISASGRFIAYESEATNLAAGDSNQQRDVFRFDRKTGKTQLVSVTSDGSGPGADLSFQPTISRNGRYVAFSSFAANIVPGDENAFVDVFVRDMRTRTTTRVSLSSAGVEPNSASAYPTVSNTGQVAYQSDSNNLVAGDTNMNTDVFLSDLDTTKTKRVSVATGGAQGSAQSFEPAISGDGRCIGFTSLADNLVAQDTNGEPDVFLRRVVPRHR